MDQVFTVTGLNRAVNDRLSKDPELGKVRVRGEISGLKKYPSGHIYFTLKDEYASVSCVLFRQSVGNAPAGMGDGMQVLLLARTNLYDKSGRFQLIVDSAQEEGVGDLYRRFLELKDSLARQGLFDEKNKKPIPFIPRRVVAITSEAGAVIRDIIHVLRRRFPGIGLILIPVPVQGAGAEREIAAAIEIANRLSLGDVIIVGRGGGSQEDLQPFNEEVTARAIAASSIPVISAVGHETDYTIADFASDLRAPTPSAAAELAVPVKGDVLLKLDQLAGTMEQALAARIESHLRRVDELSRRPVLVHPAAIIDRHQARVELLGHRLFFNWGRLEDAERAGVRNLSDRLKIAAEKKIDQASHRFEKSARALQALSPLEVLSRGYALVTDDQGRTVTTASQLGKGDALDLIFKDGQVGCEVTEPLN
ncbi:MAG TPA: exodeoxyribonuclease VII large subunit [Bacillota bacterium]|jgi:exodeoxyribonuclease VII large subunit|nr:exodeoxyribonuclease VII large subunit [Fastidiosipila sp.]HPX92949.1 exodeoxyribonuclease VII large subunit [Bacillota bacterium]HQB80763.1 exodeoxyribonuclease VII large subunit [Bacillota bacterium]